MLKDLRQNKLKIVAISVFLLMCANLLVLVILGFYNHATGDDYYYGVTTRAVIEAGGSFWQVLKAAAEGTALQYEIWQGTYSAMFLMYLAPNIYGEKVYRIVTLFIVCTFTFAVFYFTRALFWMAVSRISSEVKPLVTILSSVVVMLCLLTNPFPGESLYWYNGSMYYTWYFSWSLMYLGMLMQYLRTRKKRYILPLAFLSLFLAGGNYVSLLPLILIVLTVGVICAVFAIRSKRKEDIAAAVVVFALAALLLLGFAISAMAPGNQMREAQLWDRSAIKAVLKSIRQGFRYTAIWCNLWWFAAILFITTLLLRLYKGISFRFPCPLLVIGYLFGLFCSMSCPTLYAENSTGPGRVLAIIFYGFQIYSLLAYAYLLGWLRRVGALKRMSGLVKRIGALKRLSDLVQRIGAGEKITGLTGRNSQDKKAGVPGSVVFSMAAMVLLVSAILLGKAKECTSVIAFNELTSGQAKAYEAEFNERLEVLYGKTQEIVFESYKNQPPMLYVGDLAPDAEMETNQFVAQYFHKKSIRVEYE